MKNRAFNTEGGIDSIDSPSWAEGGVIFSRAFANGVSSIFLGRRGIICQLVQYIMLKHVARSFASLEEKKTLSLHLFIYSLIHYHAPSTNHPDTVVLNNNPTYNFQHAPPTHPPTHPLSSRSYPFLFFRSSLSLFIFLSSCSFLTYSFTYSLVYSLTLFASPSPVFSLLFPALLSFLHFR